MRVSIGVLVLVFGLAGPTRGQETAERVSACGEGVHFVAVGLSEMSFVSADAALPFQSLSDNAEIWGQHIHVLGSLPDHLPDTVVVVRWRPSPDAPFMWLDDSAPLLDEGQPVFLRGWLRRGERSDGLPILDTWGGAIHRGGGENHALPVDSLLAFCRLTVDGNLVSQADWAGMEEVLAWVRSSVGAWTREPIASHLRRWAISIESHRVRAMPIAVAGTWEAEVELPSGESIRFYFRTSARAQRSWAGYGGNARREVPGVPWASEAAGVRFGIWAALDMEHLPGPFAPPEVSCRREYPFESFQRSLGPTDPNCVKGFALAMVEPLSENLEAWQGVFPAGVLAALHPALETLDQPEDLRSGPAPRERQEFWVFSEADSISEFLERVELRRGEVVLKARRISSMAVTWG